MKYLKYQYLKLKEAFSANYIENNMIRNEGIIIKANVNSHWVIFMWSIACLMGAILGICKLLFVFPHANLLITFILIVFGVWPYLSCYVSEFGITNRRVIVKVGLISSKSFEIMLTKVEGFSVKQSILGRIFGYGDITINGTGSTKETFSGIPNPNRIRKVLRYELERAGSEN